MRLYLVCFWLCLSSVRHLPYVFRRKSTGFPSFYFWLLFSRVNKCCFCVPKLPSSRVALSLDSSLLRTFFKVSSFAALLSRTISYRTSCWHYWHISNRRRYILPLHSSASTAYGYSPSGVYPHWMPWKRCARWTICRLSVCCWPLCRTLQALFPCLLQ